MQYISFLLDETGSMMSVKPQTISGFNEYIDTLKRDITQEVRFFLTKFNSDKTQLVHEGVPLDQVIRLSDSNYRPDHMTPLYDAIGKTISKLDEQVTTEDRVLVCIQTDGEENHSREYKLDAIKRMINVRKGYGWEFVFLGADINAEKVASSINIDAEHVIGYSGATQSEDMYRGMARNTVMYTQTGKRFDTRGILSVSSSSTSNPSGRSVSDGARQKLSEIGKKRNYQRNAKGQFTGVYTSK